MSGAYVRRAFQSSTATAATCTGIWDPNSGNGHGCYQPCPSNFPYPNGSNCYQYPVDYTPPKPATPPPPPSAGGPSTANSGSSSAAQGYSPPNPANSNTSNGSHGADTSDSHNNSSVSPPDNHQQAYNNSAGYNDVFSSDPGVTNAPADVGAGADSGSSSGGMDTNTMLLLGGLAVAGILAVKMMKK